MVPFLMETSSLATNLTTVSEALTGAFSISDLLAYVGIAVGAGAGYAVTWFGVRKVISSVRSAVFGGKLRV